MWRPIKILHINLVLYGLIVCLAVLYWRELRWAVDVLPNYMDGTIKSPVERRLYKKARKIIRKGKNVAEAYGLLHKSISIDPNGEASYWLAEYFYKTGQYDKALKQYSAYLEIDPVRLKTYLKMSEIFESKNQLKEALEVLQRGLDYFGNNAERYKPYYDDSVRSKYNKKAFKTYVQYKRSAKMLRKQIKRINPQR